MSSLRTTVMTSNSLCDRSAVEMRAMIGAGELSPVDLLDATIARIESANTSVNAVVATCYEAAREAARQAEALATRGNALPALHGLPVLIKDLSDTKGLRTTYGSRCFEHHVPDEDSLIVERLRAAGAIVLGKTNTPEFGAGANTFNAVYGATCNPFNRTATSGGSSGGSAAALACSMAPLATGSDLGGSLRIPASFCSVVGMRPSPGVVPSRSHVAGFSPLWTDGPMARDVADTALLLSAISGYDRRDPIAAPLPAVEPVRRPDAATLSELRVGFSTDLGVALVDRDIADVFEQRKAAVARHVGSVQELPLDLSAAAESFRVLRAASLCAAYGQLAQDQPDRVGANLLAGLREARACSLADVARADAAHTALYRSFQQLFDDIDVLICPATAVSPFPVEQSYPQSINGKPLDEYYAWYAITWALTLTGSPVLTLPCGADHRGMPFGLQLTGPRFADSTLLTVALALEAALQGEDCGRLLPAGFHDSH